MAALVEIPAGTRFGMWTALGPWEYGKHQFRNYLCRCDCGTERYVNNTTLWHGRSKGCGCTRLAAMSAKALKHGGGRRSGRTPEYLSWQAAKQRCTNPNNAGYADYGGRGITMCDRWLHDFAAFLADMGPRPSPDHSIDRIDNDGPYAPDNCRWATHLEQHNNTRQNHLMTFNGETHTLAEWARLVNISVLTVSGRINTQKWSIEAALTTPVDARYSRFGKR